MRSFSRLVVTLAVGLAVPAPMVLASTQAPSEITASNNPTSAGSQPYADPIVTRAPARPARLSNAKHHLGHGRLALRNRLIAARTKQAALSLHRTLKSVRLAEAGVLPGFIVDPDAVQRKNSLAQASACDSILCSGYIIMGAGF